MAITPRERIAKAIMEVVTTVKPITEDHAMRAAEILEAQEVSSPHIRAFYRDHGVIHRMVSEALNDTLHA